MKNQIRLMKHHHKVNKQLSQERSLQTYKINLQKKFIEKVQLIKANNLHSNLVLASTLLLKDINQNQKICNLSLYNIQQCFQTQIAIMTINSNNNNYKILVDKQNNATYQLNQWAVIYHKVANSKRQNIIKWDNCIVLNTFSLNKRKNKI